MSLQQRTWCYKCNLRIAPYDDRTVFRNRDYHRNCFVRLQQAPSQVQKAPAGGDRRK